MALTATADPKVQRDIVSQLQLAQPVTLVASFNRPNITYAVRLMDLAQPDLTQDQGRRSKEAGLDPGPGKAYPPGPVADLQLLLHLVAKHLLLPGSQ
ncbi:ATP-dependent DNA helicase, partial [Haematococcus lacustris]